MMDSKVAAEYEEYKAVYCTLCKTLGMEYGLVSRLLLSYDATFYILLRDCAADGTPQYIYNNAEIQKSDISSRWHCQVGVRLTF